VVGLPSRGLAWLVTTAATALGARAVWGQGAAPDPAPAQFMGALMSGMVILMIPAFLICTGITVLAYRKRKQWPLVRAKRGSEGGVDAPWQHDAEPWM
jgi:hypothetical protein